MIRIFNLLRLASRTQRASIAICSFVVAGANAGPAPGEMFTPPVPYLSPEESLAHIHVPDGYRLEPVLTEPEIIEPVAIVFDGNGNLYVAEMRSYMQDIDGSNSRAPVGRVSVHWSSRDDGEFDRHEVFIDNLVLPRMMLPLDGGLLVAETDTNDIYEYRDTTGDRKADWRKLVYDAEPSGANLEHQTSGLIWAADNWIYTTYNPFRLRWSPEGEFAKEPTGPNGGQWGLTQDNYGKPWFVNAGGEIGPLSFQQPIVYGRFEIEGQFEPGFREVFPLVPIPDVQGGPARYRPDEKTLNHFTATCGQVIFRGDQLPGLAGNLLFGEPVGRLIRRATIEVRDGITYLRNAHPGSEFIRSTDPNFRPVNMENGPDGALYIVDMYRGIIQEANWVREGSYLREVVKEYSLQENYGRGRIWRLVRDEHAPRPRPRMLDESPEELVEHLAHPNGWWRDTAQRLLVLRQAKAVAPSLVEMARSHEEHLARFHAIWTLEGVGELTPAIVRDALNDPHPQIRIAAIRASESLFKSGDDELRDSLIAMLEDEDPNVVIQAMLTADHLDWPDSAALIEETQFRDSSRGVREIAGQLLQAREDASPLLTGDDWKLFDRGRTVYNQLCFACHGADGRGTEVQISGSAGLLAPPLGGSETVTGPAEASIKVMLHGLTGPIDGKEYPGQMIGLGDNDDAWIAGVLTYIRNSFGNRAPGVQPADVDRIRKEHTGREEPWTIEEIRRTTPRPLENRPLWKLDASHNPEEVGAAVDGDRRTRFTTKTGKEPGMWFQVELPEEARVSLLEIDSGGSPEDFSSKFRVKFSRDGKHWKRGEILRQEVGPLTSVSFAPTPARFIRIVNQEETPSRWWSIHDLRIVTIEE